MNFRRSIPLALSFFLLQGSIRAQPIDGASALANTLKSICNTGAQPLINRPEFALILKTAPVNSEKICTCTEAAFLKDTRLQEFLNAESEVVVERLKSERLRAYAAMRFSSAMLSCIAPELDASLAKSELAQ